MDDRRAHIYMQLQKAIFNRLTILVLCTRKMPSRMTRIKRKLSISMALLTVSCPDESYSAYGLGTRILHGNSQLA
jgi:hypothetical protein